MELDTNTSSSKGNDKEFELSVRSSMKAVEILGIHIIKGYFENKLLAKVLEGGLTPYLKALASATFAIAFAGRDVHMDDVEHILDASGVESSEKLRIFYSVADLIHYTNHKVYIYAVYYLRFLGKEPTKENVLGIAVSMDIKPDAGIAADTMKFCKEYSEGTMASTEMDAKTESNVASAFYESKGIVENICHSMVEFFLQEVETALKAKLPDGQVDPEMYKYLWAVAALTFVGEEPYKDSVKSVMKAAGVRTTEATLNTLASLRLRNTALYAIVVNHLVTIGVEPTVDRVLEVIKAFDIVPDAAVAQRAIAYYKSGKLQIQQNKKA